MSIKNQIFHSIFNSLRRLLSIPDDGISYRRLLHENELLKAKLKSANHKLKIVNLDLEGRVQAKAEELIRAVYYDSLTGLASKTFATDLINKAIENAAHDHRGINIFVIGLDRFKFINESLGHSAGDEVLKTVASRLTRIFQSHDIVARLSADMFSVALTEVNRYGEVEPVAQRVLEEISKPLHVQGQDIFLTASIGIGRYPQDGNDGESLLANAETAMRQVKVKDRNGYGCYSDKYNQMAGARLSMEAELRRALENEEFVLYYQPRVDLDNIRVVGAEALLRWRHPEKGIIPPLEFLPVLEETGLIQPVGQWVLQQACSMLNRWQRKKINDMQLAVNISAKQFRDIDLADSLSEIAKHSGINLNCGNLELEITESLVMEDIVTTRKILHALNTMGVEIAIDDFGTGYSSLSYLIQFPLDYLKIDKSFVDNIEKSDDARAIVEALISLSYSLRLKVIAEGVETIPQLMILQTLGCREFQGFLFSKPLPEDEFIQMMERDSGRSIITSIYDDEPDSVPAGSYLAKRIVQEPNF